MTMFQRTVALMSLLLVSASQTIMCATPEGVSDRCKRPCGQPNLHYYWGGTLREEMFYGKNISLLNNNNASDKQFYTRHLLDVSMGAVHIDPFLDKVIAELYFATRNKGVWGDPNSIAATTKSPIKNVDAVQSEHNHYIARLIPWIRELWLELDLATILALTFCQDASIKLGGFSFQLGRGIALGDAFAVGPEALGFYSESTVDQYAFGAKVSGSLWADVLSYDLYTALLNSKMTTLGQTAEKIRAQEFGKRFNPARGFGIMNYVVAGRLKWKTFNNVFGSFELEPYWLYNNDPEQKVQFIGDATSKLGTLGVAGEYTGGGFEFGFDTAVNFGQQYVKSYDRNQVVTRNDNGTEVFVNSHVVDQNNHKIPFVAARTPVQVAIYRQFDNEFSEAKNGQTFLTTTDAIGFLPNQMPTQVINTARPPRFRNPYYNHYRGWMIVADAAYWICEKELSVAVTAGAASGDDNPNFDTKDGIYSGFIGLQEIYSGKRVRSAFVLGTAGKAARPLSVPDVEQAPNEFADVVSGFTNLVFVGASSFWKPAGLTRPFNIQANVLGYWQEHPTHKFSAQLRKELNELASTYLGMEANLFANYLPLPELRLYFVGSIFVPGQHYTDIKGLPLTPDQNAALDQLDSSGFKPERVPNVGNNVAYTFNIGAEFKF